MDTNKIDTLLHASTILSSPSIDRVLFEASYPILFTVKDNAEEYLFICPVFSSKEVIWIGTEIDFDTIFNLLKNRITIRNAFLAHHGNRILLRYDGAHMEETVCTINGIPSHFLPDEGVYMDADEDEFEEELNYYSERFHTKYTEIEFIGVCYSYTGKVLYASQTGEKPIDLLGNKETREWTYYWLGERSLLGAVGGKKHVVTI